jgi:uncharacterized protein Yka (UPF0111/DUF47 family)
MKRRWLLPEQPDVVATLRHQLGITIGAVDAFGAWARGDAAAAASVRDAEHIGDDAKRTLLTMLRSAFVTPLEPEDLFTLSRGIDWILDHTRDVIDEADAMAYAPPDAGITAMAEPLARAMRLIDEAIAVLGADPDRAVERADSAIHAERALERAYYEGMAHLLEVDDMRERIARRELYRRCAGIGETVIDVAERVVYAVMKQS